MKSLSLLDQSNSFDYEKKTYSVALTISVLVSLILYILACSMHVSGIIDVSDRLSMQGREYCQIRYELSLDGIDHLNEYDLKFASRGCIVTVYSGDEILYEYGTAQEITKRSIGQIYVNVPLTHIEPESSLIIMMSAVDSDIVRSLDEVELCPRSETLRYYLINGSYSLPLGVLFFTLAICMPLLMLLYRKRVMVKISFYLSGILFCYAIALLDGGGHYLLFFSNQEHWNTINYIANFLLPCFCLLYFGQTENSGVLKRIICIATLINFAFAFIAILLGIVNLIPFDVLTYIFHFVLIADGMVGTHYIIYTLKKRQFSKGRTMLRLLAYVWLVFAILNKILTYYDLFPSIFRTADFFTPSSILLFYLLCYTFSEMVSIAHQREQQQNTLLHRLINHEQELVPYEKMAQVLFFDYESLYYIDIETGNYVCYYQSDEYTRYGIPLSGDDFFSDTAANIGKIIYQDDQKYMSSAMSKSAVLNGVRNGNSYSLIYRIFFNEAIHHCQIKAILEDNGTGCHIILGVRNIDDMIRLEEEHALAMEKTQQVENELRLTRLKNFNSQMQPHFLYNVLSSIQEVVLSDPEYASSLIGDFTVHLRSSIRAMGSDKPIPFTDELKNIKAYINIEKMRFDDRLSVSYDIKVRDFNVIPLSIQPLVENAIRHGIYQKGASGGTVTISSFETDSDWIVQVADDGVGFNYEQVMSEVVEGKRDSAGLKNLTFRLEKLMHAKVDIRSKTGEGTIVTVSIPKILEQ